MKPGRIILLLVLTVSAHALVFPLLPDANGAYDAEHNTISSFDEVWRTNHHAILNFHSASGAAIAPRWVLTADHLTQGKTTNNWFNDDAGRYYIEEIHSLDSDLALIKVDRAMPHYSELCKTAVRAGEVVRVYGQSAAARDSLVDASGKACGWQLAPENYHPAVCEGLGRTPNGGAHQISWPFTRSDPELGLNCAATATNDSGGGIFTGTKVAGIITTGSWLHVRTNEAEPFLCDPKHTEAAGNIFDGSTLFNCYNNEHPQSSSSGATVADQLSAIFRLISPPVRYAAGAIPVETNDVAWKPFTACAGCSIATDDSPEPMDTSMIANPPPPELYRSALVVSGTEGAGLEYDFDELIRYEPYTLRFHFAPLGPCVAPEVCRESVTVNGKTVLFDPYAGERKANALEVNEVFPDENNRIHVEIHSANAAGHIVLSALQVERVSTALALPPPLKWQPISSLQKPTEIRALGYGNRRFVAFSSAGAYWSDDRGLTWFPANHFVPARQVIFANDRFVALNGPGISYSLDGRDWNRVEAAAAFTGENLLYGNGLFVSPGRLTAISHDGIEWSIVANRVSLLGRYVAFGNGYFVSLRNFSEVMLSTDAISWERLPVTIPLPTFPLALSFGEGVFFAQTGGTDPVIKSTNGISWTVTRTNLPFGFMPAGPTIPASYNGVFVALASKVMSTNLDDWQPIPALPENSTAEAMAYGDSTYVLGAQTGTLLTNVMIARGSSMESLEAIDAQFMAPAYSSFAMREQTLVALSESSGFEKLLIVSTNAGKRWELIAAPEGSGALSCVAGAKNGFVAAGAGGTILYSADGRDWNIEAGGTKSDLRSVRFENGAWFILGANGTMLRSEDGQRFASVFSGTSRELRALAFGNGRFVAAGEAGTVVTSRDGLNWTEQTLGTNDLSGVAFGNAVFVANGGSAVYISRDGAEWRELNFLPVKGIAGMDWAEGAFFTMAGKTNGYVSYEGVVWSEVPLPGIARGMTSANGSPWVYGENALLSRLQFTDPRLPKLAAIENPDGTFTLRIEVQQRGDYAVLASTLNSSGGWEQLSVLTNIASAAIWADRSPRTQARFFQVRQE